jgi:hypothetical protein
MGDTSKRTSVPASDMKIVPCPQQGEADRAWAVVNRRGDVLANGDYDACVRRLRRMSAPPA